MIAPFSICGQGLMRWYPYSFYETNAVELDVGIVMFGFQPTLPHLFPSVPDGVELLISRLVIHMSYLSVKPSHSIGRIPRSFTTTMYLGTMCD